MTPLIPASWIVCEVCQDEHRKDRNCASCRFEVPDSNDDRWPIWAVHLAAHPELRPVPQRRGRGAKVPKHCWSESKVNNVDAWRLNQGTDRNRVSVNDYAGERKAVVITW